MNKLIRGIVFAALVLSGSSSAGNTWPQFRGPGSAGVSDDAGLPDTWSTSENIVWQARIPGRAWSSPIVWGERIFLTTAISEGAEETPKKGLYLGGERLEGSPHRHRWVVVCLDWNSGRLLWELEGMSAITIPTPVAGFGMVYVSSGFVADRRKPIYAIRPGATGDITLKDGETSNDHIVWSQGRAASYNPSPVLYGSQLYVLLDRGFLASYDARTGKAVYETQRITRGSSGFTASPWAYDGKIFCLDEDGDTFVLQAGPEFKVLRKNSLGEMCMATPSIANGSLIVRTLSSLYRIQEQGAKKTG